MRHEERTRLPRKEKGQTKRSNMELCKPHGKNEGSQSYRKHITSISQAYHTHITGISQACHKHIASFIFLVSSAFISSSLDRQVLCAAEAGASGAAVGAATGRISRSPGAAGARQLPLVSGNGWKMMEKGGN